jgi:hypothetical protein
MRKEVVFFNEGNPTVVRLPEENIKTGYLPDTAKVLQLLDAHGIIPLYEVYEDIRVRNLSILINQQIPEDIIPLLPDSAEYRPNNMHHYILVEMTIISCDPIWCEIVDKAWKNSK